MSDFNEKMGSLEKSPFFTFAKPYLDFIGKGALYNIIYIIMAVASLLFPIFILVYAITSGMFKWLEANEIIGFILAWIVVAFAGWIGAQVWWDRKAKIREIKDSEFVAIPMVSDIVQTFGEWMGTLIAIIGVGGGILLAIFNAGAILRDFGLYYNPLSLVIIGPAAALVVIIWFRLIAEFMRVIAALANNTKEIATNIKNK